MIAALNIILTLFFLTLTLAEVFMLTQIKGALIILSFFNILAFSVSTMYFANKADKDLNELTNKEEVEDKDNKR